MSKNSVDKNKKIRQFIRDDVNNDDVSVTEAIDGATEESGLHGSSSNLKESGVRAVRNFAGKIAEATKETTDENDTNLEESNEEYQPDLDRLGDSLVDSSKKVKNIIEDIKQRNASKKANVEPVKHERVNNIGAQPNNIKTGNKTGAPKSDVNEIGKTNNSDINNKKLLNDSNDIERINDAKKRNIDKEKLDSRFGKPKKRESLGETLRKKKNEFITKSKKQFAAKKSKGFIKSLIEKIIGTGLKGASAAILKILFVVFVIMVVIVLAVVIIFYFSNNYAREEDIILDSRRLDTRVSRVIFAFKEDDKIKEVYEQLMNAYTGEELIKLTKNRDRLIPSEIVEKLMAAEDPDSAFILQDSSNWILLYLERLSYAWGGYLDWVPEYIDYGVNMSNKEIRNPNVKQVEMWRKVCEKVGSIYGIDPAILLSIIDIESSGNPHAGNENYKGLCAMPASFQNYFKKGEVFYTWTEKQRIPQDVGTCDFKDAAHQLTAELHATYVARRLTAQMRNFLNNVKGVNSMSASNSDKLTALLYSITAYNQGEFGQTSFYKDYGDELYKGDGTFYTNKFMKHLEEPLSNGHKTIGAGNATYLQLTYKFYPAYANGKDISTSVDKLDPIKWYGQEGKTKSKFERLYIGDVEEEVELIEDSIEVDLIRAIQKKYDEEEKTYTVNQYNNWMKSLDTYYRNNYPGKFLKDGNGNLIAEIHRKDVYGNDTSDVIKHKSYIHNVVDTITTYKNDKVYKGTTLDESYQNFMNDLANEVNSQESVVTKDINQKINEIEDDIALNRYEMSYEVIRTGDVDNEIFKNQKAIETIIDSLMYSVPIYEYVTTNQAEARKTFFEYELYDPSWYNPNFTLKIDKNNFINKINTINNINISLKDFVNNGWSQESQNDIENRMNLAFKEMYLSSNHAYKPKNHYIEVPTNMSNYYIVNNGNVYDKMVENVEVTEVYMNGQIPEGARVEWQLGNNVGNYTFSELQTKVNRSYYISSLKPKKFTSLKYEVDFDYIIEEKGTRDLTSADKEETYYVGTVYEKVSNEYGIEEVVTGYIYKKEIKKATEYEIEKTVTQTISERGV